MRTVHIAGTGQRRFGRVGRPLPGGSVLLGDPAGAGGLRLQRRLLADRAAAWLLGPSLDRQLAAGRAPESGRLLAARADQIVALRQRRKLAGDWERLLAAAGRGAPASSRIPLCRGRIASAKTEIAELAVHLRLPLPVPARGVAAARALLADGTGPLYSRHSLECLPDTLRTIIGQLDPAAPLLPTR